MARKRIQDTTLKTWEEVDECLHIVADAENEISKIEAEMNRKFGEIKEAAEAEASQFKELIKKQEVLVKEFTTENKTDLKGKSREMNFGTVGFRLSTKLKLPKEVESVLKALKKNCMQDCIITKETVNKDVLKTYKEEEIMAVGGSLVKEDTFWYETRHENLA
ncbi:MAG: host-nuclease inhibitor Gam family protein [Lachnospiraceae bacterium]|nr:host-nuclease inhibitor Gam family protein [Lachnospiraceae bacterium]